MAIPVLLLKSASTFFVKYGHLIVVGMAVFALLATVYIQGRKHERARWIPKVQALELQIERIHAAEAIAEAQRQQDKAQETQRIKLLREHYEDRVHANNALADTLRGELRRSRGAVRTLAPASTAPAPCRDYEADRTKLPERDQNILVGLAERCNAAAIQSNACSEYALGLYARCTSTSVPVQ